jgi:hypothetical protein
MSIDETLEKIKPFYIFLFVLIIGIISIELSRIFVLESKHTPIKIEYLQATSSALVLGAVVDKSGEVIGSKSGKKYYFPWCGTVGRIKPENQVHFASTVEAKAAGYLPGGNCKGLE